MATFWTLVYAGLAMLSLYEIGRGLQQKKLSLSLASSCVFLLISILLLIGTLGMGKAYYIGGVLATLYICISIALRVRRAIMKS